MPKDTHRPSLHIDILKPQGEVQPLTTKLIKFLLSTGKYIIIFVEIIVLGAFVSRFKFDSDLQTSTESINSQIPIIQSQKKDEALIKQTRLQLATIRDARQNSYDFASALQKIASLTPSGVKLTTITIDQSTSQIMLKINGNANTNTDLSSFVAGLRTDKNFSNVSISSASLEQSVIIFSLQASIKTAGRQL